jgi:hypothetical protein
MAEQLWRIEQGSLPGATVGTVVALTREGDSLQVTRPEGGPAATLDLRAFIQATTAEGRKLVLRDRQSGAETVLARVVEHGLDEDPDAALAVDRPMSIIRTYQGALESAAVHASDADAVRLAAYGYSPRSVSWAPGEWTGGAYIVGLVLLLLALLFVLGASQALLFGSIGLAFVFFLAMFFSPPEGSLTVLYERGPADDQEQAIASSAAADGNPAPAPTGTALPSLKERLAQLQEARDAGLIAPAEYDALRADILRSVSATDR